MSDSFQNSIIAARRLVLHFKRRNNNQVPAVIKINPTRLPGWQGGSSACLLDSANELWGGTISLESFLPLGNSPLQACVAVYSNKTAIVSVSKGQNYCWARFLTVKEICHVLMGSTANYTTVTTQEIGRLISDILNGVSIGDSNALFAESLAYMAAIEALFPIEHAEEALRLVASGTPIIDIARRHKVPARVIELRLSEDVASNWASVYATSSFKNLVFSPVMNKGWGS